MLPFTKTLPQHATLRIIVLMRMVALACMVSVLLFAIIWLQIALPLWPLGSVIALLILFNLWSWSRMRRSQLASEQEVFLQLLVDMAALSVMLYFSGGATNPFVSFYLPALAIAAATLSWRRTLALALAAVLAYSLLTTYYLPLHLGDPQRAISYHLTGMWANFTVSAGLITWYVADLSRTVRQRDAQLAAARVQHMENERLLALTIQAANAAHALGTPLSTIAIIAAELRHEVGALLPQAHSAPRSDSATPSFLDEELKIIEDQVALCKSALEKMGKPALPAAAQPAVSLTQWLTDFLDQWRLRYPATPLTQDIASLQLVVQQREALEQILTTLLDNAAQAAHRMGNTGAVRVEMKIDESDTRRVVFRISDDGSGIDAELLPQLGYRQVESASGRGIGLLLAFATARQIGAGIELESLPAQGACATLRLAP